MPTVVPDNAEKGSLDARNAGTAGNHVRDHVSTVRQSRRKTGLLLVKSFVDHYVLPEFSCCRSMTTKADSS
jgi:hypothetical protein